MIINFPYFTSQAEELPDNPGGAGDKLNKQFIQVCLILAIISTLISLLTIASHLKNYSRPNLQRFVIRVLWMTPVFALSSYISLVSLNAAFYVDALRDMYEAFVIYCFFTLMVNYLGGERALIILLHNREPTAHLWPVYYFKKEIEVGDPYSFLFIKRGILQYVYVKPVITFATLYLKYVDKFDEGNLSLTSGYTYITFIYNISVSISLYCLAIFFQTTKKDLKDYRPLAKFLCVKAIIFFSFWQGLAISILVSTGLISLGPGFSAEHTSVALQDSMICFEMLFAALAQSYAFSISDYKRPNGIIVRLKLYYALRDALGIRDIIIDSKDTYTGAQFNYRTFEPVEGASRSEEGRRNRMLQGLRYSRGGQSKYWVDPNSNSSNNSNESLIPQRRESARESTYISFPSIELSFNDVERDIEAENLYKSCRNFDYGDYNIPTIEPPSYLFPRPRQHAGSRPHSKIAKSQTPVPAGTPVGRPITLTGSIPPQSQPQPQPTAQPDTQVQDFNPDRELVGDNPAWGSLPFRGTWGKNRDEEYRRIQNRDYVGPDKEFDPWK